MTRMLRPILRLSRSAAIKASSAPASSSAAAAFVPTTAAKALASTAQQRLFATQSSGDTEPPTALAKLYLEDGTTLVGKSFGCHESVEGEVVFTTGMVGYPETLTDPSYEGQIISLTSPMVGNYGVPDRSVKDEFGLSKYFESHKIHASGLLVQDYSHHYSHWNAASSLGDWLKEEGVPGISGLDTRMLTKKIREKGALLGRIEVDLDAPAPDFTKMVNPNDTHLVDIVSVKEPTVYGKGNPVKVIAVDCGMKYNIIRELVRRGAELTVVPWNYPFAEEMHKYDGLFLSNGPGDPTMCKETIAQLEKVVTCPDDEVKPIYGICMGNQLMGLAAGGKAEKLPFGNRGQNQPVLNHQTAECYITPQNHGYVINCDTLKPGWKTLFTNANDGSNEGIAHETRPYFTAQFHPEAKCGPNDTAFMFDVFLEACQAPPNKKITFPVRDPPKPPPKVKKVLMLGSGGTSIGQAGEFDYSGGQAIKALKEEGLEVVLMNPNIASVQTNMDDKGEAKADHVFFLPVTPDFVEEVIKKEKPDGIVISMGGQTALNCAVEMYQAGIFEKYGVEVLGTPVPVVIDTEDRQLFSDRLNEINEKIAESYTAETVEEAVGHAKKVGYPLMIRSAFALGGLGSGICHDEEMLREMGAKALSTSPQILVEKSMKGWKEVEYEVVRDAYDNCVTVCNMENFDPLGVHTGDSIVMAPSQTLSDDEYHMLRDTAIKVVRHLGIIGECNIQYALHPTSLEYAIIEVNPRLSRSSALASKATGYPLAFVAAKLCLGIPMTKVINSVTKKTQAAFEPSLDYIVTKIPRWDMSKFEGVSKQIGSAMKSVGEVMAIGRTQEESIQKALRMVDPAVAGFQPTMRFTEEELKEELNVPTDKRIFAIAQALHDKTMTVEEIHDITKIDHWFLRRLEAIVKTWDKMEQVSLEEMSEDLMLEAKQNGYSDKQISQCLKGTYTEDDVRNKRKGYGITPFTKQIDTLAAEYPAATNYLYMTYHGMEDDVEGADGGIITLGSGAYRIGSSIEFDWCGVSCIRALRNLGYKSTIINYNPETVSTDYDECDRLYFEELSRERVLDIYEKDNSDGIIVSVGGQIPNGIALPLDAAGAKLLGTPAKMIDNAEDRNKFSDMIDEIGVQQPRWQELTTAEAAMEFAADVGYPVLVRPSYVLSGAAMNVAHTEEQLRACLTEAANVSGEHPVVVSDFIQGAVEIEFDGVGKDGEIIAAAIHEHIENAGVHSGDATLVLPPQDLTAYQKQRVRDAAKKIVKRLNITGPVNIQFVAKGTDVMCIETNVRASRSFPFVSKTMGVDFIEAATKAIVGADTSDMNLPTLETRNRPANYVGVKAPMFSFTRLRGSDPVLGVEMASTGEVACFGKDKEEAFLKSLLSTGFKMPKKNILLSVQDDFADEITHSAYQLHELGYNLYGTKATADMLNKNGVPCKEVDYPTEARSGGVDPLAMIRENNIGLVINVPSYKSKRLEDNYLMRRTAVDFGVPLMTNLQLVKCFSDAVHKLKKGEILDLDAKTLFEHYAEETDEDCWTHISEYH